MPQAENWLPSERSSKNVAGDAASISDLGLFDPSWYLARYPDVAAAELDPLSHWCAFGWSEFRQPNPYFEPEWYLKENRDVQATEMNPLLHYGLYGDHEGRKPGPNFDPAWYRRVYSLKPDEVALSHFLGRRLSGCYIPCPRLYAIQFIECFRQDFKEGRDPFAIAVKEAKYLGHRHEPDCTVISASKLFDANFYLINGADVYDSGLSPVDHFCDSGWREGRKPNIYFDTNWYRNTNPDVHRLQLNPLTHYIFEGEAAGRRPVVYFDPTWYRRRYSLDRDESALAHFLAHRRSQRFSPNSYFDVDWYVSRFGARVGANRDPFSHYLYAGMLEDIDPCKTFSAGAYRRGFLGKASRSFPHLMEPQNSNPLVHYLLRNYS